MKIYQCHAKAHVEGHPKCDPKGQTFGQVILPTGAGSLLGYLV